MTARGYFGIGVWHPKTGVNIGTLLRSSDIFGAAFVFTIGRRYQRQASDTAKSWRHVPLWHFESMPELVRTCPYSCPIVGVELVDGAAPIESFCHPERALYLLGAEDSGLPPDMLRQCHSVVRLPGERSMNVASAGTVVMYDRHAKQIPQNPRGGFGDQARREPRGPRRNSSREDTRPRSGTGATYFWRSRRGEMTRAPSSGGSGQAEPRSGWVVEERSTEVRQIRPVGATTETALDTAPGSGTEVHGHRVSGPRAGAGPAERPHLPPQPGPWPTPTSRREGRGDSLSLPRLRPCLAGNAARSADELPPLPKQLHVLDELRGMAQQPGAIGGISARLGTAGGSGGVD